MIFLLNNECLGQSNTTVRDTDDARLYMSHFTRTVVAIDSRVHISCAGVFITDRHILTAATCVQHQVGLSVWSGVVTVRLNGTGTPNSISRITIHPDFNPTRPLINNIAIIEESGSVRRNEPIRPRALGAIGSMSRVCGMLGWEGFNFNHEGPFSLQSFAVLVTPCADGSTLSCTRVETSIENCGGPVFCGWFGEVAGIVVQDNFCQGSIPIGGSFLSVEDYQEWINEVTNDGMKLKVSAILLFMMCSFMKFWR